MVPQSQVVVDEGDGPVGPSPRVRWAQPSRVPVVMDSRASVLSESWSSGSST
jgi:hypothetical protein